MINYYFFMNWGPETLLAHGGGKKTFCGTSWKGAAVHISHFKMQAARCQLFLFCFFTEALCNLASF